jgi:dihydroceramide fatty acyl 2-hydroxylase
VLDLNQPFPLASLPERRSCHRRAGFAGRIRAFPDFLRNGRRRGFPPFAESGGAGKIRALMAHERTARLSASPPLFQNRLLDFFSRIHPSLPAIIFLPVVVAGVWLGVDGGYGAAHIGLLVALGLVIWTLTEYWLHRLVFHWEPDHPVGSRLHFIIHGVHHDHPNDRLRLVMPPAASVPLAALFLGAFSLIFGTPAAYPTFAGLILGYLAYDYTHYHVHHHTPKTKLGRRLREQHMRHHFQDHRYGFGVSSPLWDVVFRTLPRKRSQ